MLLELQCPIHHYLFLFMICPEIPKSEIFIQWDLLISASFPFINLPLRNPFHLPRSCSLTSPFSSVWFHVLTLNFIIHLEFICVYVVRQGSLPVLFFSHSVICPSPVYRAIHPSCPAGLRNVAISHIKFLFGSRPQLFLFHESALTWAHVELFLFFQFCTAWD